MGSWWREWRRWREWHGRAYVSGLPRLPVVLLLAVLVVPAGAAGPQGEGRKAQPAVRTLGVVGFYNPRLMYLKYQPLVDYLADETGQNWELRIGPDYEQTVSALCRGELTVAYLGPFTYVRAHRACGAEPVVRLATGGLPEYRSVILVPERSGFHSLRDLEGATFAFGSPLSTSSHLVPRLMLLRAGLQPGKTIRCTYFGHHDQAARAVLLGEADACGVRDIVSERFIGRGLRVLARSEPIPNFPLVVAPSLPRSERQELIRVLVEEPRNDPGVKRLMSGWDRELAGGFASAEDAHYDQVRRLVLQVFGERGFTASASELVCGGGG